MNSNKRVLVGMSGGIDSTATCLLLQEQGYTVIGVTMRVGEDELLEARSLANKLGIEHHYVDVRDSFKETIIGNFIAEYKRGRTPNPCVLCNSRFKFKILKEWADKLDCFWLATGHYATITVVNGKYYIQKATHVQKDQSYFLWQTSQEVLSRTIFPLGELTKDEVRDYLALHGYKEKAKGGESMEVCFIPGDYRDFIKENSPEIEKNIGPGWFVDKRGVKLGKHLGYPFYTIGQRKKLGIALGKPVYVTKINSEKNTVMLGDREDLEADYMLIEEYRFIDELEAFQTKDLEVRIRYRSKPIPCSLMKSLNNQFLLVKFKGVASAITPGQSAVFYREDRVVGGGIIAYPKGIYKHIEAVDNLNK